MIDETLIRRHADALDRHTAELAANTAELRKVTDQLRLFERHVVIMSGMFEHSHGQASESLNNEPMDLREACKERAVAITAVKGGKKILRKLLMDEYGVKSIDKVLPADINSLYDQLVACEFDVVGPGVVIVQGSKD